MANQTLNLKDALPRPDMVQKLTHADDIYRTILPDPEQGIVVRHDVIRLSRQSAFDDAVIVGVIHDVHGSHRCDAIRVLGKRLIIGMSEEAAVD